LWVIWAEVEAISLPNRAGVCTSAPAVNSLATRWLRARRRARDEGKDVRMIRRRKGASGTRLVPWVPTYPLPEDSSPLPPPDAPPLKPWKPSRASGGQDALIGVPGGVDANLRRFRALSVGLEPDPGELLPASLGSQYDRAILDPLDDATQNFLTLL